MPNFDFSVLTTYWPILLKGFGLTIVISLVSVVMGLGIGLGLALLRLTRNRLIVLPTVSFIELIRNLPFLTQLFLIYYILPFYGIRIPAIGVGILSLSLFGAVYYAEIIRAAITSVPKAQLESARAMGMSYLQAMRHIVIPQALGFLIPPATSQTTALVKESSVLSTITVPEMMMSAQIIQGRTFSPLEVLVTISLLYWLVNSILSALADRLEKKVAGRWIDPSSVPTDPMTPALAAKPMTS